MVHTAESRRVIMFLYPAEWTVYKLYYVADAFVEPPILPP